MRAIQLSFDDHRRRTGRGGSRVGAGRPRGKRSVVCHVRRESLPLIVEANSNQALGSGMKSISARIARAVQRAFRLSGPVLLGRYHVHALRTPREVRHALAYVLLNARKHWKQRTGGSPPVRIDAASSGMWFTGWTRSVRPSPSGEPPPVAPPRTWLLRAGWRRHGLIDPAEVPGR